MDVFQVAAWVILGGLTVLVVLPAASYWVGKFFQVGKLEGTRSFVKRCEGEKGGKE